MWGVEFIREDEVVHSFGRGWCSGDSGGRRGGKLSWFECRVERWCLCRISVSSMMMLLLLSTTCFLLCILAVMVFRFAIFFGSRHNFEWRYSERM